MTDHQDTTTGLTADRLAELRKVAEGATDGPWHLVTCKCGNSEHPVITTIETEMIIEAFYEDNDAPHVAAFDPPTALALLDRIAQLERERDEARAKVESITSQWRATGRAEADAHRRAVKAEATLERIRESRANHPECDRYDDNGSVVCGWKRTVQSIDLALIRNETGGER